MQLQVQVETYWGETLLDLRPKLYQTPSQCSLTLGILLALPLAISNYRGIASKTQLVDHQYQQYLVYPSTLSYDFLQRILKNFDISTFEF